MYKAQLGPKYKVSSKHMHSFNEHRNLSAQLGTKYKVNSKEMHSFNETTNVPAFLAKLWRLVGDPDTDHLICWSKNGRSFIIKNQAEFARDLLPLNYKHSNMASFIRQLNMYGFHKITSIENGGLKGGRDEQEFSHPDFRRNRLDRLELIKRKLAATKKEADKSAFKPEIAHTVLTEMKAIRERQESMDSKFSEVKQENETLWRHIAALQQKHAKQQAIVNKLIQYLITIVKPPCKVPSVNRRMPLMIENAPQKLRKKSETEAYGDPVVNDLKEELLYEIMETDTVSDMNSPVHIERPQSSISLISQNYDYSNQSTEENSCATAASPSIVQSLNSDESEIIYHVTEVPDNHSQDDLDDQEFAELASPGCNEENVLTTPMVRKEMARTNLLKKNNKNRRKQSFSLLTESASNSSKPIKIPRINADEQTSASNTQNEIIQSIKSEELDPMEFVSVYDENPVTDTENLVSPNHSEDSHQFVGTSDSIELIEEEPASPVNENSNNEEEPELYENNNYSVNDMPDHIFEESSSENSNLNENDEKEVHNNQNIQKHQLVQNKVDAPDENPTNKSSTLAVDSNDISLEKAKKLFSSMVDGNGIPNISTNGASTSAAAASASKSPIGSKSPTPIVSAASTSSTSSAASTSSAPLSLKASPSGTGSKCLPQDKNYAMAIANYTKNCPGNSGDIRDELYGHVTNVQEELDTLKALLQTGGHTLDASTLMGLFNDTDILNSYASSLPAEGYNEKRNTQMLTYPSPCDFSELMEGINANNEYDCNNDTDDDPPRPSSVLNTPYHD